MSGDLFARALDVTPGGVNSPVRAFGAVGGTPRFMARGHGPYLYDVDGNEYVDLVCSWGPMILGHAHPEVVEAVTRAVAAGTSFGTPSAPEVELAEEIVARTPVDQVRLVSSGTEATMSAIRLARGFTGPRRRRQVRRLLPRPRRQPARRCRLRRGHVRAPRNAGRPGRQHRGDRRAAVQRRRRGPAWPSPSTASRSPA